MSRRKKEPRVYEIANGIVLSGDAAFETEPRYRTLLIKGFIVYLVVMGSLGCLLSSFTIPYNALVLNIAVAIGSLFSAFLYYNKVWENVGYFILFAFMLGTAIMLRRYISSGFFAVVNIISERISYYFDTEVVQGYAESVGNRSITVTVAFVYVGWVHAILLNALISRQMKYFAVMFTSFFFLTVPFYLEREPDMLYILMLLAGCMIVFAFRGARHTPITGNDKKFEYIPKKRLVNSVYSSRDHMITVVLFCLVIAVGGGIFQTFINKDEFEVPSRRGKSAWKLGTEPTVENLYKNGLWALFNRYDSRGGLKSGLLGGINSVNLDYETDIELTYVPYSAERLYIRSFEGDKYLPFENRWQSDRNRSGTGYTHGSGVSKTAEALRDSYEKKEDGSARAQMDIKNVAAGLVRFFPYYTVEDDYTDIYAMNYRTTYPITFYPMIREPKDPQEKSAKDQKKVVNDKELADCLSVPDENLSTIDSFISRAGLLKYKGDEDASGVIGAIAGYFQEKLPYSYQPGATPRGEDFINYFLDDNKKGYCAHFASAAVLILRRLGFPARYIEGYAVDPTDMAEDAKVRDDLDVDDYYEGDMLLNSDTKVVTVSATDAMAHAWVEVLSGGHWRVAEVTPWSDEEPPDSGFLRGLIDFFAGTGSDGSSSVQTDGEDISAGSGLDSFGRMLGSAFLIIAVFAALCAFIILMVRVSYSKVRYMRAGPSDRLVMDFHRVMKKLKNGSAINYSEGLKALDAGSDLKMDPDDMAELKQILEKAGFSGEEITDQEYERAKSLIKKFLPI
ncbi:MAG: transglutaminase domain-containing protein [Eubacterium sp.]|nr:transglutaminase domain-containing protein [Eubacterium sp.]